MTKLVIAVDIDDDLGRKAHLSAPVIGEQACLEAATRLAVADPEDPDANVIFKAIKIYRSLKKKSSDVEIVLLAGHKDLGIKATKRISNQLDTILKSIHADSAILVTDGVSDESIVPVIDSRVKIEATDVLYVKQAKELEKAYFLLIEKLKDPYYAKIVFGLPALILIFASLIQLFNIPWQYVTFIFGAYLLARGFSIDNKVIEAFNINIEGNLKALVTVILTLFIIVAFVVTVSNYESKLKEGVLIAYASSFDILITFIFFIAFMLAIWKTLLSYYESNAFRLLTSSALLISLIAIFLFVKILIRWIINDSQPFFSFADVIKYGFVILASSYIIYTYLDSLKKNFINNLDVSGMNAYNAFGDVIGAVQKIEGHTIVIKDNFGKKIEFDIEKIEDINKDGMRFK
ncbi:MAG: DUF373 family protein [Candidatus Anstonellales archaeon]